jgi:nicotinate-nucleotide--dimethylbenzimidazole phosphoribosyltransferase
MSDDRWNTVLVLGGIRSGKSAFAEALVAGAPTVRYVATAVGGEDDPEWLARIEEHQRRRPQSWTTEETGADPARLTEMLAEAKPDETLLVDDLGGWVAAVLDPARQPNNDEADVAALAAAVRECTARVVLVSPEVGLSLVPTTPIGRAFTDALGTTNRSLAEVCDAVALVVAGRPVWLKEDKAPPRIRVEVPPVASAPPFAEPFAEAAIVESEPLALDGLIIQPGIDLPLPDDDAGVDARERLDTLDFAAAGLGVLVEAVEFAAATQGTTTPSPWAAPRVLLIAGGHSGGAAAGEDAADVERRVTQVTGGHGVLNRLAGQAGADIAVVRTATVAEMEDGPVLDEAGVDAALRRGWQLADQAADDGRDVLVLASIGVGTDAVATAVMAATTGAEPVAMLPRVQLPGGRFDDNAWMVRCAAVRDTMHRIRQQPRGATDILRQIGGPDFAVATGALLGAANRRLPVVLDGPVGVAAALVARDIATQARHWCLVPDTGDLALVRQAADVLGLAPVVDLKLGLGEGANALAALPLLRTAVGLAAATGEHPALSGTAGAAGTAETSDAAVASGATEASAVEASGAAETIGAAETTGVAPATGAAPGEASRAAQAGEGADAASEEADAVGREADEAGATEMIVSNDGDVDFAEPEPGGPGPATTGLEADSDHTASAGPETDAGTETDTETAARIETGAQTETGAQNEPQAGSPADAETGPGASGGTTAATTERPPRPTGE